MAGGNGEGSAGSRARRLRRDRLGGGAGDPMGPGRSGRRFVVGAIAVVLLLWGGLHWAHRSWRARYLERRDYGAQQVAPLVDPLGPRRPPGAPAGAWAEAVRDTHAMLVELAASGPIDRPALETWRRDVAARVEAATPETAAAVLARLWADVGRRAGPAIAHARRPELLRPALALDPLARLTPRDRAPDDWRKEVDAARSAIAARCASGQLDADEREALRRDLARLVAEATPATAARALSEARARAGVGDER